MENIHNIVIRNPQGENEMLKDGTLKKSWQKARDETRSITRFLVKARHSRKDTKMDIQFRKAIKKPHKIQMIFQCPLHLFL